jgi:hypothetical protein
MPNHIGNAQALIFLAIVSLAIISFIPEKKNGKWPWET